MYLFEERDYIERESNNRNICQECEEGIFPEVAHIIVLSIPLSVGCI